MSVPSRAAAPAQPARTYSVDQLNALQQQSRDASALHLMAAAEWLSALFQANNIAFVFMGGFSLQVRGSPRDTYDVDVAVDCEMSRIINVVTPQSRVLRPLGPVSGVMRIFIKTGGQLDTHLDAQLPQLLVEADLILAGSLGAPNHPEKTSEAVSIQTRVGPRQYRVLNLQSMMASKLGAAFARNSRNDHGDLVYLVTTYPAQIWALRHEFSNIHRQHFINYLYQNEAERPLINKAQKVLGIAGFMRYEQNMNLANAKTQQSKTPSMEYIYQ